MLFGAAIRTQKKSMLAIFFMMFLGMLTLFTSYTLLSSGHRFMATEMDRLGFGDFTVWIRSEESTSQIISTLEQRIEENPDVAGVETQPLIYVGYEINGRYSDNEGQLLVQNENIPYQFITKEGSKVEVPTIEKGTVYISPALASTFDVGVGDMIQFELLRSNGIKSLQVAGYFADGFMGSSMIDMKSFLISEADFEQMGKIISTAPKDEALGKNGAMLHISKSSETELTEADLYKEIQESTDIALYTEFTYHKASILNYMLLLQNILAGFMLVFSLVLGVITIIIVGHSFSSVIEQEQGNIAILKTMGLSGKEIRIHYLMLYGSAIISGMILGAIPSQIAAGFIAKNMVSSTGLLVQIHVPYLQETIMFLLIIAMFGVFVLLKTRRILHIAPMVTIREENGYAKHVKSCLRRKYLAFDIAIRDILSGKRKYCAMCLISMCLALFLSIIGRLGSWLGPNGEGLMNTFSVAEHDLGVQPFNNSVPMDEIERVINWYSPILDTYELAMQSVTVNGQEYTANVLDDTKWFHIIEGNVCEGNSILITETVASEQDLSIGDTVIVAANGRTERYTVSGVYQCANGMGTNIGMSMAGYSKIGDITGFIWCTHYILQDGSVRDYVMQYLQEHYSGIDVHTNSWSGLTGIVRVMQGFMLAIYVIAAMIISLTVSLTTSRLLQSETVNIAVYQSLGLSASRIRRSFSLRFLIVNLIGAGAGIVISEIWADKWIQMAFRNFGISEFVSRFSFQGVVLPVIIVPVLFFWFAWMLSKRIKKVSIVRLISENKE